MHCIDRIERQEDCLVVIGWFFKIGANVKKVRYRDADASFEMEGYGKPSDDLAAVFDASLVAHRFEFSIEGGRSSGLLEFSLDDGSSEGIRLNIEEQQERVVALRHQIHDGVYKCKLKLLNADSIKSVSLSKGDVLDHEAAPVEKIEQTVTGEDLVIEFSCEAQADWTSDNLCLHIEVSENEWIQVGSIPVGYRKTDPAHKISNGFINWINDQAEPLKILEVGSRARSGITRSQKFDSRHTYLGIDVIEGVNVDLVCDAHTMSKDIEANSVDAAISYAVFEHLAMPWKVVLEMNKVMKVGARCMIFAPHTWPMHETPFDFWRYSDDSWRVLFNRSTGFKLLESACGEPSLIRPEIQTEASDCFDHGPGYLCSAVIAEKTHDTKLQWDVPIEDVYVGEYPY